MNTSFQPLSQVQAEVLRQILNEGNAQIPSTLEMILGERPQDLQVRTTMAKLNELQRKVPDEPMVSVRIRFEGDIEGQFLFLQPRSMSKGLKNVLKALFGGRASTSMDAAGYIRDDWVQANRASTEMSDERVKDTLGELSNVLFGGYLTTLYSRCSLATFLELPEVLYPDDEGEYLRSALNHFTGRSERCYIADVQCMLGENHIHFWLVMMAEPEGFRSMLDAIRKDTPG